MARNSFPIKSESGLVKCYAEKLTYSGDRMADECVTLKVRSSEPIDFEVGDYIEYRGEKFSLVKRPSCKKTARRGTDMESFSYESVKMWPESYKLRRIEMRDVVGSDDGLVTLMPDFSFYAKDVTALAERMMANISREYEDDEWVIKVLFKNIDDNADEDALYCYYVIEADGSTHYEGKISGYSYEAVGEKDQTVSISSQSVWSAMTSTIPDIFKINFIVRGREIVIGKEGISFEKYFKNNSLMYGMNKGAVSIESVPEENSEDLITRLYAYGNSTNMPARYYQRSDVEYYATFKTSVKFKSGTKTLYAARINKRIDFAAFQSGKEIPARYQNFGASYSYNVKATYNGVESKFVAILMGTYTYLIPDEDGKENMFADKCVGDAFYESSFKIVSNVEKSTVLQDEGFKTKITVARNSKNGHVSELSTLSSGSIFKFLHDGESSYFSEGDVLEYPNITVVNDDLVDGDKIRVVVDKVTSEYLRFKLIYSTKTIVPASAFVSIPSSLKINGVDYDTTYNGSSYVVKDLLSETAISDGYSIALSKDQFVKGFNGTDVYPQYIEDSIGYVVYGNSIRTEEISEIPELDSNQDVEINYFRGIVKRYWPVAWTRISNDAALPNNVNVQKLMLPGFPDMSLKEFKDYDYKAKPVSFEEVGERGVDVKMVRLTLHLDKKIQNKYQHSITGPVVFKRKFLTGESGERIDVDMNNVYDGNLYLGDTLSFVDEMPASQADLFVQGATIEIVSGVAKTSDGLNVTAKISYVSAEATSSVATMFFTSDIEYSDDYFEQVIRVSGQDYSYKLEYNELYETWSIKDVDPSEADTISNNITSVPLDIVSGVYAYLLPEEYVTKTPRTPEIVCSEFDTNPYIESFDKDKIGLFEKSVTFDGSVDGYEDIHPSIEDTTFEDIRDAGYIIPDPQDNGDYESDDDANTVAEGSSLIDSGLYTDMSGDGVSVDVNPSTFSFKIKKLGFDLEEAMKKNSESKEISFKSGMCGGRTFSIIEGGVIEEELYYKIICKREYDDALDRYFPYNAYNIQRGDKFVLLGISLPDMYIRIAAEKLYDSAIKYLNEHNYVSTSYSFEVDSIYMQRQHDSHVENNEPSLHDTLKAGDYIRFTDEDIISDIESGTSTLDIVIDKIEITEGEDELPKYSITLRENKKLTKWQQIEKNFYNTATSLVEEKTAEAANSAVSRSAAAARKASVSTDGAQSVSGHKTFEEGVRVNGGLSVDDIEAERLSVNGNSSFGGNVESDGYVPGELGYGWKINSNGQAEFDSMSIRKFLDVPELRYNKTTVLTGIQWHTVGAGAIEEVHIDSEGGGNTGYIKLKLEDGEYGAISVGDMCMGIFHNEDGGNELSSSDGRNGNFKIKGFQTVYFKITALCDENGETENPDGRNQYFKYALRPISDNWTMTYHPRATMSFACYANSSDSTRQCCMYSTTEYTIMLVGMVDWEYNGNNISLIEGNLNGFSIPAEKLVNGEWVSYTQELTGYGIAFGNAYMWGNITQFNRNRYLVSQQIFYYSSDDDLETVVGKWDSKELTIDDFSTEPVEPSATSKNVFSVFKYTYSDNTSDYSTPSLFAMYGTEGKSGAMPNLYGLDCAIEDDMGCTMKTKSGFFTYGIDSGAAASTASGFRIYNLGLNTKSKYVVSFDISGTTTDYFIVINALDNKKTYKFSSIGKKSIVIETGYGGTDYFAFNIISIDSYALRASLKNFKIEEYGGVDEATPFAGLKQSNIIQKANLLNNTATFDGMDMPSGVTIVKDGYCGNHAIRANTGGVAFVLNKCVSISAGSTYVVSWYQKGGSITFSASGNEYLLDEDGFGTTKKCEIEGSSEWVRHTAKLKFLSLPTSDVRIIISANDKENYVYISTLKLEESDVPTAWQMSETDRIAPSDNMFGYESTITYYDQGLMAHKTDDGIVGFLTGYKSGTSNQYLDVSDWGCVTGEYYIISFVWGYTGSVTINLSGNVIETVSAVSGEKYEKKFFNKSKTGEIDFCFNGGTLRTLVELSKFKIEKAITSSATTFRGIASDNMDERPNLLSTGKSYSKWTTKECSVGSTLNEYGAYTVTSKSAKGYINYKFGCVAEEWYTISWYGSGTYTFAFSGGYWHLKTVDGKHVTLNNSFSFADETLTRHSIVIATGKTNSVMDFTITGPFTFTMPMIQKGEKLSPWKLSEEDKLGSDGKPAKIIDGYWYDWDPINNIYVPTGVKAKGEDGVGIMATLSMDNIFVATVDGKLRDDYMSEEVSVDVYEGSTKCTVDSVACEIIGDQDGFINATYEDDKLTVEIKDKGEDWGGDKSINLSISATSSSGTVVLYKTIKVVSIGQGKDGTEHTIDIDDDGYWVLDGETTAFKAEGDDGHSPKIVNGYWYEWNPETGDYQNTNIEAEGKSGLNAVSMYLSANTIVFPTKNGNIDTYAIDRTVQVKIYEGSNPKDTTITGATITGASGVSVSYSGDVITVSPQAGSAWTSDGSLNVSASAVINGETVTMGASINVVGSAQGQTVAGPQGESVTKIEEKYYATATKVAPSKDVQWQSTHIDPSYALPYVWNIEIITFYNPAATGEKYRTDTTEPHLCCEFADGMTSHTSTYAVTSTNDQPSVFPYNTVQAALDQMDETTNRFLWNREVTSYKDPNKNTDVVRLVTIWGEKGTDGKSVDSVTEKYCYGTDTAPSGNWTSTALLPTSEDGKRYVWNKEIVTYTNSDGTTSTSELTPHIIARYTSDGKGVQSYTTTYAVVSTSGVPNDTEFVYTSIDYAVSALSDTNKYLWELETTYYTDNTNDGGVKRLISVHGKTGDPGTNGTSITSVTEQYAYGTETTPSTWGSSALTPKDQDGKRYVWNREAVTYKYSDNSTETKYLTPHIIARYVSDGRGVSGYTTTYAVTSTSATPSEFPYNDIASAVAVMSAELRFLWEKEITTFTDGTNDGGEIRLIAVNGLDGSGEDGADAPRPNIFGYDCVVSGTNTGNSIMRTDNGIVAYAKKTDSNNYYSVSIKLPENIISGKRIGVHGTIYSPAGGDLTVVAVNASGSEVVTSSVTKITGSTNIEFASSFTLPNACRYIIVMVYPKSSLGSVITNYAGILQIKNLKIEDTTEISSTKTAFDGLSSYSIPRGENMLTNITSYDGWTKNANTSIERGAFQGQSVVSCGVSSNTIAIQKSISLKAGTRYTLSWWDKASSESMSFTPTILISDYNQGYTVLYSSVNGVAIAGPSSTPRITYQAETEWTYRTIRFVAIGDVDASVQFYFNGTGTGYMSKPKLEEGDCDTEWIESPEDRKGLNGCVIRNRGEWNADTVYINESELNADGVRYIDIVQYEQDDVIYYYQRNTYSSGYSAGVEPTNSRYWTSANVTDFIASKLIMTESEWVTMLSGKKIYVTDSTNEVVAGIQSVTEDDSPMIFAGASENNANSAKFRVYNNGRTVLENVEVKSADSVGNTLKLKDGSVQIIDKNGNILTTISQQSPSSVSDTMPSIPAQTDYASGSAETSGSTACVASDMTAQFVYYTEKEICSITPSNDGGVLKVPEIKYTVSLVSGNMTSSMNQIVMRYEAILYVDGEVEYSIPGEAKQSTSYINYTSSESTIPSFSKTVLKGVKTSVKLSIKTTYIAVLKSASTSTVQIPANSTKMTLSSVVSSAVEYGTYMNKILGNGFAFTNNSNSFFSYVNSVPTGDESMRFGQGNLRLSVKNGVQRISKNGGTNYANANPLVMVIRYTVSGGSISGREAIYNPFGLGVVAYSGSVDLTKNVADVKYSTNIFSFNHNMFGTSDRYIVQCMPVKTSACYAYIHSKASTYFRIGFSSEPTSFDVMIFDGLSY